MNDIELAVLKILKGRYGKGHAIDRARLVHEVNLALDIFSNPNGETIRLISDRAVREAIETLRQTHATGARIMSSSGWSGYWLLNDVAEFEDFYQEERSAAISRMARLRKQRDLLRQEWYEPVDQEPQIRMFA